MNGGADVAAPRRMRRRLTVAFAITAAASAGGLAIASYALVADARYDDSLRRGEQEIRFGLAQGANLTARSDLQVFADGFEPRGVHALVLSGEDRFSSDPGLDPAVPGELRETVAADEIGFSRIDSGEEPYLVLGGRPPGSRVELYLLVSEEAIADDLALLARVLALAWLAVVALAALAGRAIAVRTLAPVAEASRAAEALAEGLLTTRLPARGADEFGRWASSFNEMAEALEAKIAALEAAEARERRFTSDVSHELRTPLTALVAEAALLERELDSMPPTARRSAELLIADTARLRRLVEELIEISRLDAGQENVRIEPLELGALAEAVVRAGGWGDAVEVDAEAVPVRSDRRRLERAVSNLVANAIAHGGGRASVRIGIDGSEAFVEVSDQGPGISDQDLEHVFERFYKADRARSGAGSGLGLAIAAENAELIGGRIEARSSLGEGSAFTLRVPVAKPLPDRDGGVAGEVEDRPNDSKGDPR